MMAMDNSSEPIFAMGDWDPVPSYYNLTTALLTFYKTSWNRLVEVVSWIVNLCYSFTQMNPLRYTSCIPKRTIRPRYLQGEYRFPRDFIDDVELIRKFTLIDAFTVVALAISFTLLRSVLSKCVITPICRRIKLTESSISKMPESAFKLLFYAAIWIYCFNIIIASGRYRFFQKPTSVWDKFSPDSHPSAEIYWLYMFELAFYVHGMYALFFQDAWRKDSHVMCCHHVVTIILIWISFMARYHSIGACVMLCHDGCDILLEVAKINVYLKVRDGVKHKLHEILAAISFASMGVTWFVFRLYYFPLKVLYAASVISDHTTSNTDYSMLLTSMLLALQCMNMFWFGAILFFLYKLATGELEELDDIREYDVVEKIERSMAEKREKSIKSE